VYIVNITEFVRVLFVADVEFVWFLWVITIPLSPAVMHHHYNVHKPDNAFRPSWTRIGVRGLSSQSLSQNFLGFLGSGKYRMDSGRISCLFSSKTACLSDLDWN